MEAVFKFRDAKDFLAHQLAERQKKNQQFSLRAFSKQLGFKTPSLVSAILSGKRKLSVGTAKKMAKALRMSVEESTYFELLALRNVGGVPSRAVQRTLKLEEFRYISEWHHVAILEMLELKEFDPTPANLAAKLKHGFTEAQVVEAIERLKALELVATDSSGRLRPTTHENKVGDEVPDKALQQHHISMMETAIAGYKAEPMSERDVRGSIFAIREADFPKAVAILRECHARIRHLSTSGENDVVCRFSTQLFKLTK